VTDYSTAYAPIPSEGAHPPLPAPVRSAPVNNDTLPSVYVPDSMTCRRCGVIAAPVVGPGSGPHIARALCSACGTFIDWLSRYSPEEKHARRRLAGWRAMMQRAPSAPQLAYLKALGDRQPLPTTMAEACARIDALRKGEQL
jgi:hypothetical protein